ncbi:unnamed protein product [Polarella glacialis]|uniref:Uncharacterized protein n=2 Tax=Polarella glacialis TaxID=89957 RepID=A0A813K3C7_POLGL|nr:unnamed protein product [Polarella glacialis]
MSTNVLEMVQETLFQQFLGGSNPTCRLSTTEVDAEESRRVEDLPWWRYKRQLALWHCEWLDTYYDSGDHTFLWRNELTQGFDPADLEEVQELAGRLRVKLPEKDVPCEALDEEEPPEAGLCTQSSSGWQQDVEVTSNIEAENIPWTSDEDGNSTHWAADVGRSFLWQEKAGVLYEYVPGKVPWQFVLTTMPHSLCVLLLLLSLLLLL